MAADPKDTTANDESVDSVPAAESSETSENGAAAGVTATTGQKLCAEELIRSFEAAQQKSDLPDVYVGDTVRVGVRISEGNKERVQPYEGVVISKRHGGLLSLIHI